MGWFDGRRQRKAAEESRRWRHELELRVKELKAAGYDTSRLEEKFLQDDETLRAEWVKFRIQLKRAQEQEAEIGAIPPAEREE